MLAAAVCLEMLDILKFTQDRWLKCQTCPGNRTSGHPVFVMSRRSLQCMFSLSVVTAHENAQSKDVTTQNKLHYMLWKNLKNQKSTWNCQFGLQSYVLVMFCPKNLKGLQWDFPMAPLNTSREREKCQLLAFGAYFSSTFFLKQICNKCVRERLWQPSCQNVTIQSHQHHPVLY